MPTSALLLLCFVKTKMFFRENTDQCRSISSRCHAGMYKAEMSYKFALDSFLFNISANPVLKFRIILENATPPIKCKNIAKKSCNPSCEPVVKY